MVISCRISVMPTIATSQLPRVRYITSKISYNKESTRTMDITMDITYFYYVIPNGEGPLGLTHIFDQCTVKS